MKKLTNERRALLEPEILKAREALQTAETLISVTPEWRANMKIVWSCQELLEKELGLSMTRQWLIVQNKAQLNDYFLADGTPIKVKR